MRMPDVAFVADVIEPLDSLAGCLGEGHRTALLSSYD